MSLYLVQHGKSLPKDQDPEKGLSEEGIEEVQHIAQVARTYHIQVSKIEHSGKKRAKQTAEILSSALRPPQGTIEREGIGPMDDVASVAQGLKDEDLMLVGHLPFMESLAAYLVTGSTEKPIFKFQNGGIVALTINPDTQAWIIKWALMPHIY
jgi:phosphohistidine phosphatase